MTTRPQAHEFPGAFAYEQTDIPAGLTIREWRQLDAQQRHRRGLRALWRRSRGAATRVILTEHRTRRLIDSDTTYISPRRSEEARSLIALLAGITAAADGGGPWRQPVAGRERIIELERQ